MCDIYMCENVYSYASISIMKIYRLFCFAKWWSTHLSENLGDFPMHLACIFYNIRVQNRKTGFLSFGIYHNNSFYLLRLPMYQTF